MTGSPAGTPARDLPSRQPLVMRGLSRGNRWPAATTWQSWEPWCTKIGLHIPDFTWEGGPPVLRSRLGEVARRAEQAGIDRISVMDHVWQIGHLGPPEHEMLEAYATLGWLAAGTERGWSRRPGTCTSWPGWVSRSRTAAWPASVRCARST
jgi:hypothetical protein